MRHAESWDPAEGGARQAGVYRLLLATGYSGEAEPAGECVGVYADTASAVAAYERLARNVRHYAGYGVEPLLVDGENEIVRGGDLIRRVAIAAGREHLLDRFWLVEGVSSDGQ